MLSRYHSLGRCFLLRRGSICLFRRKDVSTKSDMPRLVDRHNGEKSLALFSDAEYESRLSKLQNYMASNDISAAVFTSYHNIIYYSGFVYCQFGRNYGLIVTPDGSTTISAGIDHGQPWRRGYGDNITYTDWHRDNFYRAIKETLKNTDSTKIGVEYDHISLDMMSKMKVLLPKSGYVDIAKPAMHMRMVKSPEEIQVIRDGARIADLGGEAGVETLWEGVPEYEVAMHSTWTMVREIAKTYPNSDIMDTWTWFASGINTDGAHNPVTTRRVQKGDVLSLNCFPMIQGYYAALERTLFFDHASEDHIRIWEKNCEVHTHGQKLIRPGAKCCDIAHELNDIYRQHDLLKYRSFGYGHSFGIMSHYYGREADLELREDIETVLEPGMVVSMEPMITIPEGQPGAGGYREHDILIVTDTGAENITKFPYGPSYNIRK